MPTLSDLEALELHDLSLSHSLCVYNILTFGLPLVYKTTEIDILRVLALCVGGLIILLLRHRIHVVWTMPRRDRPINLHGCLDHGLVTCESTTPSCTSPPPPFSHFERVMQAVHLDRMRLYEIPFLHQANQTDGRNHNRQVCSPYLPRRLVTVFMFASEYVR